MTVKELMLWLNQYADSDMEVVTTDGTGISGYWDAEPRIASDGRVWI